MLWASIHFIDYDYYEKHEKQLMGLTYTKYEDGVIPLEFFDMVREMVEEGQIKEIGFSTNYNNMLAAMLYVIHKMGGKVNKYNFLTIIYNADRYSLNKYAKPVTGDRYVKKEYGFMPYNIKNMLEGIDDFYYLNMLGIDKYPFRTIKEMRNYFIVSNKKPNNDYLSESDTISLNHAIDKYGYLSFEELLEINNKDKAFKETNLNKQLPFENIINNPEAMEYLKEYSRVMVL